MVTETTALLVAGVLAVSMLYSSVGQAGASGYIAVMSLFGIAPAEIKTAALALNVLVASIASWQFSRAGLFEWSLFWPFTLLSVPMAVAGGYIDLPSQWFNVLVGIILLGSALQLIVRAAPVEREPRSPPRSIALCAGAGIGLLSGLTGTGGGIFLTPLLIFRGWARTGTASGISAPFVLVNSVAALGGNIGATKSLPAFIVPLALAAVVGGSIGAYLGSRRLPHGVVKRLLAVVLAIAGVKLVLT